jgi:hypothetical protein
LSCRVAGADRNRARRSSPHTHVFMRTAVDLCSGDERRLRQGRAHGAGVDVPPSPLSGIFSIRGTIVREGAPDGPNFSSDQCAVSCTYVGIYQEDNQFGLRCHGRWIAMDNQIVDVLNVCPIYSIDRALKSVRVDWILRGSDGATQMTSNGCPSATGTLDVCDPGRRAIAGSCRARPDSLARLAIRFRLSSVGRPGVMTSTAALIAVRSRSNG